MTDLKLETEWRELKVLFLYYSNYNLFFNVKKCIKKEKTQKNNKNKEKSKKSLNIKNTNKELNKNDIKKK